MRTAKKLCLNMIVKNELANLERCLGSVAPYIACWVIGDTGSTDGTQDFITGFFGQRGIPGELHQFPFIDFAQARNEALLRARAAVLDYDYLLLTDADMELVVEDPDFALGLTAELYQVLQKAGVSYWNTRLIRRDARADYKGVTHEFVNLERGITAQLRGVYYIDHATGSNRVDKYERDARLLTRALEHEAEPGMVMRYTFYLANTLRDAGQLEPAVEQYLRRAALGGWQEEIFMSLYAVARIREQQGRPDEEVIEAYLAATKAQPRRAEALHDAARYCRNKGLYQRGYELAQKGLEIPYPIDGLFVSDWIYAYGLLDELAINAYWIGRYEECAAVCERLLKLPGIPDNYRTRIRKNRDFALDKMREAAGKPGAGATAADVEVPGDADDYIRLLYAARAKEDAGAPDDEVIDAYLAAARACPSRAEALHGASRYCRQHGKTQIGLIYAERGLAIPRPEGVPYGEDWVYEYGMLEEFSITANYARDPAMKQRGFEACDFLALNRDIPEGPRALAFSNTLYYVRPFSELAASFTPRRIEFTAPEGFYPTNPSVAVIDGAILVAQRTVNYTTDEYALRYDVPEGEPIRTRNFLLRLAPDLTTTAAVEIHPPVSFPPSVYPHVAGFEDPRIFQWRGALWCVANVREFTPEGWCEQLLARIDQPNPGLARLADWRVLKPEGPRRHQKNWMPRVVGDELAFVYLCDPTRILGADARLLRETIPPIHAENWRGGSQLLPFAGGHLALIHDTLEMMKKKQRFYHHRFVWFDAQGRLAGITQPFYFMRNSVEFAAGLAWHPDGTRLLISFGVRDQESWIATVSPEEVRALLIDAAHRPDGTGRVRRGEALPWDGALLPPAPVPAASAFVEAAAASAAVYEKLAPYLAMAGSPAERREAAREADRRIDPWLRPELGCALPQIHCFYEVMREGAQHDSVVAAVSSMLACGHPVRLWSYAPQKLGFLAGLGVKIEDAGEILPRGIFEMTLSRADIRYFSDLFRYAVLHERGGLWMDTDVVLLRRFPFAGSHFFNLQWRHGGQGHFVCGNVIYAAQYSRHMRALYERAIGLLFSGSRTRFGDVGPALLSDYLVSAEGKELQAWLFSPMFFNSIDWTETDVLKQPIAAAREHLHDRRVFGVHLWGAITHHHVRDGGEALINLLSRPTERLAGLQELAERYRTDRNRHFANRHFYSRIYARLLQGERLAARLLLEIGPGGAGLELWRDYFPFCSVIGLVRDGQPMEAPRLRIIRGDAADLAGLGGIAPGSVDIIIDDGTHASRDQQAALRALFPLLAPGGWYFIEDLDWQPPGEDGMAVSLTKALLQGLQRGETGALVDPYDLAGLRGQMQDIHFFDSHYELQRAGLLGGLVAIRKIGAGA